MLKELECANGENDGAERDQLPELGQQRAGQRDQPKLLGGHPRDQRAKAILGDPIGAGVEVGVLLAVAILERSQQAVSVLARTFRLKILRRGTRNSRFSARCLRRFSIQTCGSLTYMRM